MKSTGPGSKGGDDVLIEEGEARLAGEVGEVGHVAGAEIVDAEDGVALPASRASVRCEPRKPAAPVTRIFLGIMSFRF